MKYPQRNTKTLPLLSPTQAKASGLAFSLSAFLLTALGLVFSVAVLLKCGQPTDENDYTTKDWYLYVSYILPQICLLLVSLFYFLWLKKDVKQTIKEQKCHPKYFFIALLLQIGLFSLGEANGYFLSFLEKAFSYELAEPNIPNLNGWGLFWTIIVIGLLPAVFEELFFRETLLKGLRSFGTVGGILLCGGLFSLYHQNPAQTIYQFLCGCAFALIVVRAGSILPTILAHFINNTTIILLEYFKVQNIPMPVYITLICVTALCLIGSLTYLIFFDKSKREEISFSKQEKKSENIRFFVCAGFGIISCAVNWLLMFVDGFLG